MATSKLSLGPLQSLYVSILNGLADGSAMSSLPISNSIDLYLDVLLSGVIVSGNSGVSSSGKIHLYAYGSIDGGTTYSDGPISYGSHTLNDNAKFIASLNLNANSTQCEFGPFSVASAFGGFMPERWGVIVKNNTGSALYTGSIVGVENKVTYRGIKIQTV